MFDIMRAVKELERGQARPRTVPVGKSALMACETFPPHPQPLLSAHLTWQRLLELGAHWERGVVWTVMLWLPVASRLQGFLLFPKTTGSPPDTWAARDLFHICFPFRFFFQMVNESPCLE